MSPLETVLERLEGARRTGSGWMARCPAHDDRKASLSVSEGSEGAVLVHCHAGCETEAVVASAGLAMSDLFEKEEAPSATRRIVANYSYTDGEGKLLYEVVRYQPEDFRQRRPDGPGGWIYSVTGVPRVLYGLPALRAADARRMVFVLEGEKDVDRLTSLGLVATTNAGGALKWRAEYAEELRGRSVVVIADNDETGRRHAREVAESLLDVATSVRIVELPGLPEHGDVSDWLDAGGTIEELKAIVAATNVVTADALTLLSAGPDAPSGRKQLPYVTAAQLASQTPAVIPWRVRPYLADGAITELDGKPKTSGKTTFLTRMIRALLDGEPFLGGATVQTPVVLLSEQGPTSLRAALDSAGLLERDDLYIVLWRDTRGADWTGIAEGAAELCRAVGARVLIVDTLPQFAGLAGDAENDAGSALAAMEPLQAAAADGLAVFVSRHDRKGGGEVGESARGSGAFTGAVDIVLALRRGDGESRPTIRHLHAVGRFDETPDELVIELTPDGYVSLGSASNVAVEEAKAAVLATLGDDALALKELEDGTGLKRTTLQAAIEELVAAGQVGREGRGKKGDPYRFSRAAACLPEPIPNGIGPAESISQPDRGNPDLRDEAARLFGDDARWAA